MEGGEEWKKERGEKRKICLITSICHNTKQSCNVTLDEIYPARQDYVVSFPSNLVQSVIFRNSQSSDHVTGNATQNTTPSSHVRESLGTRPYTYSSYSPQAIRMK